MKLLPCLVFVSLAANAVLLAITLAPKTSPSGTTAVEKTSSPAASSVSAVAPTKEAVGAAPVVLKPGETLGAYLAGDSLETTRDRLLAAGFPLASVRRIVAAIHSERLGTRQLAFLKLDGSQAFWQSSGGIFDQATMSAYERIGRESKAELARLFGADVPRSESEWASLRLRFGGLSAEKIAKVESVLGDYADIQRQEMGGASWGLTASEKAKADLLEKEKRADLEAILTPEELLDYDVRQGSFAGQLRNDLASFRPTEAEFRALLAGLRGSAYERRNTDSIIVYGETSADPAREAALAQAKAVLSPERYAEFAQATDRSSYQENRLVARLGLPLSVATNLKQFRTETMAAVNKTMRDNSIPAAERQAAAAAAVEQAKQKAVAMLGAEGYAAYEATSGRWLKTAIPTVRPPTPTPKP